ncbi:retinol dehydrogenase 11 isoform X1 [Procambarus clarkii]|uniref:retinol dehydrogenase 11 isoform X1 n=1 Tax=Procambarus clarkii TaxID=6728 RepID=UPI003744B04B
MLYWAAGVALVVLAIRIIYRYQSGRCYSQRQLVGKTVVVTGASAGIGKEAARDLARRGARVILACRDTNKAQKVADDIMRTTGNRKVAVRKLDTSDLASVRKFARGILATETALHVLVNNAGIVGMTERKLTSDGLELTMATNHFGHFLLTNMLLGLLKDSAPSRVVNVSSVGHKFGSSLDPDDLNYEKKPFPMSMAVYGQTKLANILFTNELSNRLRGTSVTANSVHPGAVFTEIHLKEGGSSVYNLSLALLMMLMAKDEKLGAETLIHLAVSEEVDGVTGKYFVDCKESNTSDLAKDQVLAKKLWSTSERLVKLKPEETHY